jgi:hypothetical protein
LWEGFEGRLRKNIRKEDSGMGFAGGSFFYQIPYITGYRGRGLNFLNPVEML